MIDSSAELTAPLHDRICLHRANVLGFLRELHRTADGALVATYDDGSGVLYLHRLSDGLVLTVHLDPTGVARGSRDVSVDLVC